MENRAKIQYQKEFKFTCPLTQTEAHHTVWYTKSTCTRFEDPVHHFKCDKDPKCSNCREHYE